MRSRLFLIMIVAAIAAQAKSARALVSYDRQCKSKTAKFTILPPPKWYLLSCNDTSIDLVSFPPSERLEGVIIKDGGAEISIETAPPNISNMESWLTADRKQVSTSSIVQLLLPQRAFLPCRYSHAVEAQIEMGPGNIERDFSVYCGTLSNTYRFRLRAWTTDPHWPAYKAALIETVKSLKEPP